MNILDLNKGDKVFVSLTRTGNGFAYNAEYIEEMEVRDITADLCNGAYLTIRLAKGDMVKIMYRDNHLTLSADDFKDGIFPKFPTKQSIYDYLAQKTGCQVGRRTPALIVWMWNKYEKIAYEDEIYDICESIFRFTLPDGCYPTKEACEKANKKTIKMRVIQKTERIVEVDANTIEEAEEWLDNHINEYISDPESDYVYEHVVD